MRRPTGFVPAVALLAAVLSGGEVGAQQCTAPKEWFPHTQTPAPDFHDPGDDNCAFHQWSWQTFLWLTQQPDGGRIRMLSLPTGQDLFSPGRAPPAFEKLRKNAPLLLTPRVAKKEGVDDFGDIFQAGSRGVLVDPSGRAVYYAVHVDHEYYKFVRDNQLYLRDKYLAAPAGLNFPVKSVELKSSWRIVGPPGTKAPGAYTTDALIYRLKCRNGGATCVGDDIVVDRTKTDLVSVALVGVHVVGVVENHPEFIWATFEHKDNAPDLPSKMAVNSPNPVDPDRDWTFYRKGTAARACNLFDKTRLTLDVRSQALSPRTDVFREFAYGGGNAADTQNVKSLNESVHAQLGAGSVWSNYFLVGGVWFNKPNALTPGLSGPAIQRLTAGSVKLSNATMETFTQHSGAPPSVSPVNCFSCHNTAADPQHMLPPKNLNISHILRDGLVQRETAKLAAVKSLTAAAPLKGYADVQKLLTEFVEKNNVPITLAPHGAFWSKMTYKEFIEGNVPNVSDPATGNPLKVLVVKDSKGSNLIMALRGTKGSIFDPDTGTIGRMPPSGPFMPDADIDRLAAWIDRGCPE